MVQTMEAAKVFGRYVDRSYRGFRIGGICGKAEGGGAQLIFGALEFLGIFANDDDFRSRVNKSFRGGEPKTAGAPDDDNGFAREAVHNPNCLNRCSICLKWKSSEQSWSNSPGAKWRATSGSDSNCFLKVASGAAACLA